MAGTAPAYRVRAEQSAALVSQLELLRAEQHRSSVLDERSRIAREIHDVLAHSLGALGIQIQATRAVLSDTADVERALGLLDQAQRLARDGLVETRRAVQALRTDSGDLDTQLSRLVDTHRTRHHVEVGYRVDGGPRPLGPDLTLTLVRTAQEALVNSAKHAPGEPVDVRLRYGDDRVTLTITNSLTGAGTGAPSRLATANAGYGLTGIRERLLLLHGQLTSDHEDDRWTLTAEVPR